MTISNSLWDANAQYVPANSSLLTMGGGRDVFEFIFRKTQERHDALTQGGSFETKTVF